MISDESRTEYLSCREGTRLRRCDAPANELNHKNRKERWCRHTQTQHHTNGVNRHVMCQAGTRCIFAAVPCHWVVLYSVGVVPAQ